MVSSAENPVWSAVVESWIHPAVMMVATDLTDLDRLLPHALAQASRGGLRLILLHVIHPGSAISLDASGVPLYDPTAALQLAERMLEPWCAKARAQGVACDALLREGNPTHQITAAIQQFQVGRLLIGSHGKSPLKRLLLGSTAEQLLHAVPIPVMTIGPEATPPAETTAAQPMVLYATTLRPSARPAAMLACRVAATWPAKLRMLHVLSYHEEMEPGEAAHRENTAREALRQLAHEMSPENCGPCAHTVEATALHGNPSIEILAQSVELAASLIVLGSGHPMHFEGIGRDRVCYRVLAHARCPVLTLREPAELAGESRELAASHQSQAR